MFWCDILSDVLFLLVGKDYYVFFSFYGENLDYNWVKVVMRELEFCGFKCCVFFWDFDVGKLLLNNIKFVLIKCLRIVIVLFFVYIKNEWF